MSNLPSDSPARIRLLAKFVENQYEKPEKLLEIRDAAQGRLKQVEKEIEAEKKVSVAITSVTIRFENANNLLQELIDGGEEIGPEEEDLFYLRRLDGGLFTLQTVDYILAWIVMEDDGVRLDLLLLPAPHADARRFLSDPSTRAANAQAEKQFPQGHHRHTADLPRQHQRGGHGWRGGRRVVAQGDPAESNSIPRGMLTITITILLHDRMLQSPQRTTRVTRTGVNIAVGIRR